MKSDPSLEGKIEQYLLGRLPRDEQLEVERAMRDDPDFALEVELRRLEFDTAEELIATDIRALYQRLREQERESGKMSPRWGRRWYYYAAAASVALLAFLLYRYLFPPPVEPPGFVNTGKTVPDTFIIQLPPRPPQVVPDLSVAESEAPPERPQAQTDVQRIAIAYYGSSQDWNKTSSVRGSDTPGSQDAVGHAIASWQRGAYPEMLQYLDTIQADHPRYYAAQLLLAHANFKLGKYKEAAAAARAVVDWKGKRDEMYVEEAEWLLVLSLLAQDSTEAEEFRTISGNILKDEKRQSYADMVALRDELLGGPNFAPNPSMDALAIASSRSEGLTIKISSPPNDARFAPDKKGEVLIRFAGTVEGATAVALTLNIFDNKNSNKPLLSVPLELKKDATTGTLTFDFQQQLMVAQGLYYFSIEREGEAPAYAGKFTVKN